MGAVIFSSSENRVISPSGSPEMAEQCGGSVENFDFLAKNQKLKCIGQNRLIQKGGHSASSELKFRCIMFPFLSIGWAPLSHYISYDAPFGEVR